MFKKLTVRSFPEIRSETASHFICKFYVTLQDSLKEVLMKVSKTAQDILCLEPEDMLIADTATLLYPTRNGREEYLTLLDYTIEKHL